MKKVLLLLFVFFIQVPARIFFVGSNPFNSSIAFPQDILLFPADAVYLWPSYQQLPWWGDIDEPERKPNDNYTTTEEAISLDDGRHFEQDATIHSFTNRKGFSWHIKDNLMSYTLFESGVISMVNKASGRLRSDQSNPLPFEYSLNHVLGKLYLQPAIAFAFDGIPVGLKAGIGFTNTIRLKSSFEYTIDGVTRNSEAFAWGWARQHCNSIFDMAEVAGDAFVQDVYARGPVWQFDLQGGATLPRLKLGVRYRTALSSQVQYSYDTDNASGSSGRKLDGTWEKSDWTKKSSQHTARVYGNYNWFSNERVRYNTLFFLGYSGSRSRNSLSSNQDVDGNWRDLANNVIVEINPNVNINFGMPMFFLDAALLVEYSYTRFSNRYNRWVNGGNTDSYRQTSTHIGEEYASRSFSFANDNFFDVGFDMNLSLPVYRDKARAASLSLILFVNNKFTKLTKYYISYPPSGTDYKINFLRTINKRETWFHSMWLVTVRQEPWTFQIDVAQPLLYKLRWDTKVIEKNAAGGKDRTRWTWMKEMPFAAQQGVSAGFFIAHDLQPLLRRFK